jgi:phosphate transport system permease protein
MPLIVGSLKVALVAILFAAPLGITAAVYTSEFSSRRVREVVKPIIELVTAIPAVVLGFFAVMVLASTVKSVLGLDFRFNALTAGIALGIALIPLVYTIADETLSSVPASLRDAATALGGGSGKIFFSLVLPTAFPGILTGLILGFGRALGETMIVLMVSGNAAILSADPTVPVRTLTATIASELQEAVSSTTHYSVIYLIGLILFLFTLVVNTSGNLILGRLSYRLQSKIEDTPAR